ncbi:signal peptidase I [Spirochaeta cellobiosiphila]|uniref:signal peptidase I n=1 Tax=Spirochaeta cellobiosiphila TaxID=504483 RepID=UPI000491FAF2|nr:signal peptidase I [Spirochaeta cellobiosiphila]
MSKKYRPYNTQTEKKHIGKRIGQTILVFFVFKLIIFQFFPIYQFNSTTMTPTFEEGARVITLSSRIVKKYNRGDVVIVNPQNTHHSLFLTALDYISRFVTFEQFSLISYMDEPWASDKQYKRLIALPGDKVKIIDNIAYVKTSDNELYLSEFELSKHSYDIRSKVNVDINPNLPIKDDMDEITVPKDEIFVLDDNRIVWGDSRFWGTIDKKAIIGKVLFQYWPFDSIGIR